MPVLAALRRPAPMPPAMSPERQRLAEIIAANAAAEERTVSLTGILERAQRQRREAQDATHRAREKVETAAASAAQYATQQLMGGDAAPAPMTPAAARAALQEAEDTEATAVAAETNIEAELTRLHEAADRRKVAIRESAGAVLLAEAGPAIRAGVVEIDQLQRQLADRGWWLTELEKNLIDHRGWSSAFEGYFEAQSRYDIAPGEWRVSEAISQEKSVAAKEWRTVVEALTQDASAPVPKPK